MIFLDDETESAERGKSKRDTQQDARLSSLQTAVDSLNSQIAGIKSTVNAINSSISDKYAAQTQALMNELSNRLKSLAGSLAAETVTERLAATSGNLERLAVTVSATVASIAADVLRVTGSATVAELSVANESVVTSEIDELAATRASIETATIGLLNATALALSRLDAEKIRADEFESVSAKSETIESDLIKARNVTGKGWQTPISTPDNTELFHVVIPSYNGIVQVQTQDDEFSATVFNDSSIAVNQKADYFYRIEKNEDSVDLYLQNIGDTINYRILYIGSEKYRQPASEIVDKSVYERNAGGAQFFAFFKDSRS